MEEIKEKIGLDGLTDKQREERRKKINKAQTNIIEIFDGFSYRDIEQVLRGVRRSIEYFDIRTK